MSRSQHPSLPHRCVVGLTAAALAACHASPPDHGGRWSPTHVGFLVWNDATAQAMAEAQEFPFESEEWAKRANPDYIDALARKDPRLRLHGAELHSHWSPKGIFFLVDAGPDHVQHTPDDEIVRVSTNKWIKK